MKFRVATRRDLDRLAEIDLVAYPDDRTIAARHSYLLGNSYGKLGDFLLAVEGREILGQARLFALEAGFGGRLVKMGGIASVAVAPEARGRGVATALVEELHRRSDARGDAVTMLYPFQVGFYARLGYAVTPPRKRLVLHPAAIPAGWRLPARRLTDLAPVRRLHARVLRRETGWVVRSRTYWERFVANERRMFLVAEGGYVAYFVEQPHPHGPTTIVVDELVAEDGRARRGLLGALAAFRDQATAIVLDVADADPLVQALGDIDRGRPGTEAAEHVLGEVVGGPMVRLVDVRRAIEARGYPQDGSFSLAVDTESYRVEVRSGRAKVTRSDGRAPTLRTSRPGLAALLYGGLGVEAAVDLGLAEVSSPQLAPLLTLRPLLPIDAF